MLVGYIQLLLVGLFLSPVATASDYSTSEAKDVCTCKTVQNSVCMSWECENVYPKSTCFPGSSEVLLDDGSKKILSKLQINDRVLVADGTFEPIIDFLHLHPNVPAVFLRISTRNSTKPLFISAEHLIFLFNQNQQSVLAHQLRSGDRIQRRATDGSIQSDEISEIHSVMRNGYFAPLTPSGTIVVDDVVVSTYATVKDHHLAHRFMSFYRFWIRLFGPSNRNDGSTKEQIEIHWILKSMEKFAKNFLVDSIIP